MLKGVLCCWGNNYWLGMVPLMVISRFEILVPGGRSRRSLSVAPCLKLMSWMVPVAWS